jgi:hypothetical protein
MLIILATTNDYDMHDIRTNGKGEQLDLFNKLEYKQLLPKMQT